MDGAGAANDGEEYRDPSDLWSRARDEQGGYNTWYRKAVDYWDQQEPTYNGVLGGFGYVSDVDVRDSRQLLEKACKPLLDEGAAGKRTLVALDCGAGVGRVTRELLQHYFHEVDLLEPSAHLLETAEKELKGAKRLGHPAGHRAVNFYQAGLQQHVFESQRYTWLHIQWCLLYLTDDDVLHLFSRCRPALQPGGLIFVKENVCKQGFVVDKDDCSLTRSNTYMLDLFAKANLELLYNVKQRNFPKELFEVRMYVLRPR